MMELLRLAGTVHRPWRFEAAADRQLHLQRAAVVVFGSGHAAARVLRLEPEKNIVFLLVYS